MKIFYKEKEITMLDEKTQKELENMIHNNYDNLYSPTCIFCNEIKDVERVKFDKLEFENRIKKL